MLDELDGAMLDELDGAMLDEIDGAMLDKLDGTLVTALDVCLHKFGGIHGHSVDILLMVGYSESPTKDLFHIERALSPHFEFETCGVDEKQVFFGFLSERDEEGSR